MDDDRTSMLYAGYMGICAVLANVLIDKGIITQSELCERFEQARDAAEQCSSGPLTAIMLAEMVTYLEPGRPAN
jgi:hypothetical protein